MQQETKISNKQYSPYFASVKYDPEQDTENDRIELTRKFILLPRPIKHGLLDIQTEKAIQRVANLFSVSDPNKAGEISRIVRDVFFNKISEDEIKKRAQNKIEVGNDRLDDFNQEIRGITNMVEKAGREQIEADLEKLPIIPALKKHEQLGEQEVTEGAIKIEVSEKKEFVEPTIKNWLEDYIQNKGAQAHDNLERSDYLYKSSNTENLTTSERDKLAVILRSYDMDELITISKEDQEVFFDVPAQGNKVQTNASVKPAQDEGQRKDFFGGKFDLSSSNKGRQEGLGSASDGETKTGGEDIQEKTQKPHEINWYGASSPFDNLEKIDAQKSGGAKQGSQEWLENRSALTNGRGIQRDFHLKHKPQKTKHVVDLKEMGK